MTTRLDRSRTVKRGMKPRPELFRESGREGSMYPGMSSTPTGVTNATPGAFTPAGSGVFDLAALRALGALGETVAWSQGQFVWLRNGNKAHWDGDSWENGPKP